MQWNQIQGSVLSCLKEGEYKKETELCFNKQHVPDSKCPFHLVNVCSFPWIR